jgi:hypothetical protein
MKNQVIRLNTLLQDVINDAVKIGIPVSDKIDNVIHIDNKRYDRVAACYRYFFPLRYEIHISYDTLRAKEMEIKNIIAHEVLHTCFLSMDHGIPWVIYQKSMNDSLGYNIQEKYSWYKIL